MAQWSIVIWEKDGKVQFSPSTLNASAGDEVFWSNQTDKEHKIEVLYGIPFWSTSAGLESESALFTIPASIKYQCENQEGTISIKTKLPERKKITVSVKNNDVVFEPNSLKARAGDEVRWMNKIPLEASPWPLRIEIGDRFDTPTKTVTAPPWGKSEVFKIPTTVDYKAGDKTYNALYGTHEITIEVVPGPTISNTAPQTCLSPTDAQPITLTGTNLLNGTVTVNGAAATVISTTNTTLVFKFKPPPVIAGSWAEVIVTTGLGTAQTSFAYAPAIPTISGLTTFCQDGSATLKSSSESGNQWYLDDKPIDGATSQKYGASAAGRYTVKVTVGRGCPSATSAPTTVRVNPPPAATISASGPTKFCEGGSVTLTASAASSYRWSTGATTQSITVKASGSYSVTVTDANGCSATSAPTIVTVNPLPAATISASGPTKFCEGGSVMLTASAASSYRWSTGATTQSITVKASGSYSVTVTDANGCSAASAPTSVTVNPLPAATITGPTAFCEGGSVTLTASAASSYRWSTGATAQSITVNAPGSYSVTVTDANGCSATSAPTILTVNPLPVVTLVADGPTTFCEGGSVTLTVRVDGETTMTQIVTTSSSHVATYTDLNGCTSKPSDPIFVTVNPNPNATITAPSTVVDNAAGCTASVADAGAGATYTWMITNGTITDGTGTTNITFKSGALGTLTLACTVTTSCGCKDTKSKNIEVVAQAPLSIDAVAPERGITDDGQEVITSDPSPATNVVVDHSSQLTAVTPEHPAVGKVKVTVTYPDGSKAELTDG